MIPKKEKIADYDNEKIIGEPVKQVWIIYLISIQTEPAYQNFPDD